MTDNEMTGKRIKVQSMNDPYVNLKEDDLGTVVGTDELGNLIVDWDKGVTLKITPEIDEFEIVEESRKLHKFFEFKVEDNINVDFISAKMYELSDLVSEYSGISFEYHIHSEKENSNEMGILEVSLSSTETDIKISWILDLDKPNLKVEESTSDTTEEVYSSHLENIEEGLDIIEHHVHNIFEISERKKAQRYKGRKIPGKYLAGPHPSKMKKEIDRFVGKKEYKKDWDADYKSGKGGEGERVKTKKSAATKAYQKMFGDK